MTKLRIYLSRTALILLTLLLAACYDYEQDVTTEEQPVDILSRFNAEGKAWLSLNIGLPDNMTRTYFSDGDGIEYAIKTLTLVLFRGESTDTEDELTVASIYDVSYTPQMDSHQQITHHSTTTVQITDRNIRNSDKLYLLTIANASPNISEGDRFSNVKTLTLSSLTTEIGGPKYFVMTNAPLTSASDGTGSVTALAEIDPSFFAATEADALAAPACYVYLERAAAKVTTKLANGLDMHVKGNMYISFDESDFQYSLFNYNMTSNLIRQMDASWLPYYSTTRRFVEQTPLPNLQYCTYWARDINYDDVPDYTGMKSWKSMGQSDYCAENTFDVSHMQDNCTTSVLVRLQLNNGGDFYTTSVTGQDIIFQPPTNDLSEEGTSASESFVRRRSKVVTYDGSKTATIDDYLRTWLMEQSAALRNWVRDYAGNEKKHLKIEVSGNAETGLATATLSQTAQTSGTGFNKFESLTDAYAETGGVTLKAYLQALLNSLTIKFYDDGYCYYRVLIRHFDDTQTPWSSAASMTDNTPAVVYGGDAEKYLGRYGMVRNNWYNISINSVTHVGSPIIPPLTTNADDKVEQLLNATLHISGWEKHEQNL